MIEVKSTLAPCRRAQTRRPNDLALRCPFLNGALLTLKIAITIYLMVVDAINTVTDLSVTSA